MEAIMTRRTGPRIFTAEFGRERVERLRRAGQGAAIGVAGREGS